MTVMQKLQKKARLDAKAEKDGKTKTSIPIVAIDDALDTTVESYIKTHERVKTLSDKEREQKIEIEAQAIDLHREYCAEKGFVPTISLGGKLNFTAMNKYNGQTQKVLSKFFPKEIVENPEYFKTTYSLKVKDDVLDNPKELGALFKLLGKEGLERFFVAEEQVKPSEKIHEQRYTNPEVADYFNNAIEANVLKSTYMLKKS